MEDILVEIHLRSGRVMTGTTTVEDALAPQGGAVIGLKPEWTDREKAISSVATRLAIRIQKGEGSIAFTDTEGRLWVIQADAVAAFSIGDYPKGAAPVGFGPLLIEAYRNSPQP